MEKKVVRPKAVIGEMFFVIGLITYMLGFVILLGWACGGSSFEIMILIGSLLGLWILFLVNGFIMYRKDHVEIDYGKVIIDQKVKEWDMGCNTKGGWIHQKMEINLAEISKIGFSYELYGKYLYYHSGATLASCHYISRAISGMCGEVTVEMNDGKRITFDPLIYTLKQLREIIKVLSRNGEVQLSPGLKKYLRRRFFERKIQW